MTNNNFKENWNAVRREWNTFPTSSKVIAAGMAVFAVCLPINIVANSVSSNNQEMVAKVVTETIKPPGADTYDATSGQWLCAINKDPLTGSADGYYPCPNGTTETERQKVANFEACVKRSGKQSQTAGWSWAASQCRENTNFF